jgi:coenzyme F420 biosynthesis associated uncharacterized protein
MGVRYMMERAAQVASSRPARLIDWRQAREIAVRVSRSEEAPVVDRAGRTAQYARLVARSEPLLAEYMQVHLPAPISRLHVVDRREWLLANIRSFEHLFAPIEELYLHNAGQRGSVSAAFGELNSKLLGAQMGVLLGFLARRVLGQYDLSLLSPDPETRGTLYFVEPNIRQVQQQLGLVDEDFRLWITLHECTHVFQFEAYPWVRQYFNELLNQFLAQVSEQLSGLGAGLSQMLGRVLRGENDGKHWIEQMLTPQQQQVFARMQALMSIVEGYSNHTMDAIGEQLLPSFRQIEQRIQQRQQNRPLFEILFNRITGMDLKLAQYQQGEAFVNAVVAARGIAFANRVWERPENLPTMDEIRDPQRWIARLDGWYR